MCLLYYQWVVCLDDETEIKFGLPHLSKQPAITTYQSQGRYTEAEQLFTQVLNASKQVLGENHPDTLGCMHNLANTYKVQGRYTEA